MVLCKNCKHWEPNQRDKGPGEWLGMHECLRIKHENDNSQEHDIADLADLADKYGYRPKLKSKGVFGCVLGEAI